VVLYGLNYISIESRRSENKYPQLHLERVFNAETQ